MKSWFFSAILKHYWMVLLISGIFSAVGAYYSVQLYKNLRTDLEELLPQDARSVQDLNKIAGRLESVENLSVLIFSENSKAGEHFVDDLVRELGKVPPTIISSVEYNIQKELEFFQKHRVLYIDLEDIVAIRDYIKKRIQYERNLYNPITLFASVLIPPPELDIEGIQKKYSSKVGKYGDFPNGYYATKDGKIRTLIVHMPGKSSGIKKVTELKNAVENAINHLNPKLYAPDMEIRYTGGVQNTIEEQGALVADLVLSTVLVAVLVGIALWVYFLHLRATIALLVGLFAGTFWTFGISYFTVGYLNANSAFLGSIILGNGINFPIILVARYLEERRKNLDHAEALTQSMKHTATATWVAALAAGFAYGSLMLTSFRGFRQFGIIGLIGMVLCWIAGFTVLPALLSAFDSFKTLRPKKQSKKLFVNGIAKFIQRYPIGITLASLILSLYCIQQVLQFSPDILESDLRKLRNKVSMTKGSGYLTRYSDEIFGRYLSPVAILPETEEQTVEISERLQKVKENQGNYGLINRIQTLQEFLPKQQPEKIQALKEIQQLLRPSIYRRLKAKDQKLAYELLQPESRQPIHQSDLPPLILKKFTEKDGRVGRMILVEPPLGDSSHDRNKLVRFIHSLRRTADSVAPGTAVAGALPISSDMIESITKDGPKATLFAFLSVVILVILLFRNFSTTIPVLLALVMGVLWMGGFIFHFWYKINFLNFIALPITFGIGVDYSVNIFQRYREEGSKSLLYVIRETGGAVILCSITTLAGWGSLMIAENQAFVSFGTLAVVGEFTCIIAAVISLPAMILTWKKLMGRL